MLLVIGLVVGLVGVGTGLRLSAGDERQAAPKPKVAGRVIAVAAGARAGGDGSQARPFASIQRALVDARPGDTVRVGPGVYAEQVRSVRPGRQDAPIRLVGAGASIRGFGTGHGGSGTDHLVELTHDDLELRGFDLSGAGSLVWMVGVHRVRLLGNHLHGAGGECVRVRGGSVDNELAGNSIDGCGAVDFRPDAGSKNGEGIYVGTAPEQEDNGKNPTLGPDRSGGNWIHDNVIDAPAECVDLKEHALGNIVERNRCTGGRDPKGGGLSARGSSNVLRDNVVSGEAGAGIRLGGDATDDGIDNDVRGNRLTGNAGWGLTVQREPQGVICGNGLAGNGKGAANLDGLDPAAPCPA